MRGDALMASSSRMNDLGLRTATALAMVGVAGLSLWIGGMIWTVFVLAIGVGVWFEWSSLSLLMNGPGRARTGWRAAGAVYAGMGCALLISLRDLPLGVFWVLLLVGAVIGTDIGAYFLGRLVGGPKIAPRISPSKTWAGLVGGIIGATSVLLALTALLDDRGFTDALAARDTYPGGVYDVNVTPFGDPAAYLLAGAIVAVVAQAGDFFESWMKRRAGVKDSGRLLPGHGGLFDRVDGLLAVSVVCGLLFLASRLGSAV